VTRNNAKHDTKTLRNERGIRRCARGNVNGNDEDDDDDHDNGDDTAVSNHRERGRERKRKREKERERIHRDARDTSSPVSFPLSFSLCSRCWFC